MIIKGNKPKKRLHSMDTEEVSIVTAGANGHNKWLVVKDSDGREYAQQIPVDTEPVEVQKEALGFRSKRYGIEMLSEGGHLTVEKGMPSAESLYGDPVNLLYPMGDAENKVSGEMLSKALESFKENVGVYSDDVTKTRIIERIVRKAISQGIEVQYDPDDALNKLLPVDLKSTLQKQGEEKKKKNDGEKNGSTESPVEGSSKKTTSKSGNNSDLEPDFKTEIQKSRDVIARFKSRQGLRELREAGLRAIESVKKKKTSPSEPSSPQDEAGKKTVEKKDPERASLEKRAADQAVEIKKLKRQLTEQKAAKSRQNTAIGMSTSLRPREQIGTAKVDQASEDEARELFDLSPPLENKEK